MRVCDLLAGYGKLSIIHQISFEIGEGEIVSLIGPNGSGKSTLLKSIFGLTDIISGSIIFENQTITGMPPERVAKMGVGYVPQRENVFPNLSVRENLEIGATTLKDSKIVKNEIAKIFELFPVLYEMGKKKARTLSGGQRQMLALGRALVLRPKMILLDEPTAALAPQIVSDVLKKVKLIRDSGVTVLIAEQNAREALDISDKGIVLASGNKIFEGAPNQISGNEQIIKLFLGV